MDNGDIETVRAIFNQHPNGRFAEPVPSLDWRDPAPWSGQQRLIRMSLDTGEIKCITPFRASGGAYTRRQHTFPKSLVFVGTL